MSTGKLTPLLKEELKCRLQMKCFLEGKVLELNYNEDKSPPVPRTLLPAELARLERRREQNRRAAKKFRQKKKCATGELTKIVFGLEKRNKELRAEIIRLVNERNQLVSNLSGHPCQNNIPWLDLAELEREMGISLSDDKNTDRKDTT
ncbi:hypothetical protein FSP39_015258 [Pinctada imbricata]|uniref:BZIP domain-containing protein n=1 Tax=Pinctada imbricata TaxID=66713 RepID=A0AA88Y720_PINIB|nr:hypothetical protein FSP39_015258 [Pinctada imbricata]